MLSCIVFCLSKHPTALYTQLINLSKLRLILSNKTYSIYVYNLAYLSLCFWDSVYHYCLPLHWHHALFNTLHTILVILFSKLSQLFWSYSLCSEVPIIWKPFQHILHVPSYDVSWFTHKITWPHWNNINIWPEFGKPTELSHLVFWEIPFSNIETTVVFVY